MKKWQIILIILLIIILIPVLINFGIQIPSFFPYIGTQENWLMFWPTYLSAAVSLLMVYATFRSLKHGEAQLNELKRQWYEEHKPEIVAYLVGHNNYFYICVKNISKSSVKNIRMFITHEPTKEGIGFRDEFVNKINKMNFSLEPQGRRYINLNIICLQHNKEYNDYIGLRFTYDENNEYSVDLPFSDGSFLEDSLNERKLHDVIEKIPEELNKIANSRVKK